MYVSFDFSSEGLVTLRYKGKTLLVQGENVSMYTNGQYYIIHDSIEIDVDKVTDFYSDAIYNREFHKNYVKISPAHRELLYSNEEDEENTNPRYVLYESIYIENKEVIDIDKWVVENRGDKFEDLFDY